MVRLGELWVCRERCEWSLGMRNVGAGLFWDEGGGGEWMGKGYRRDRRNSKREGYFVSFPSNVIGSTFVFSRILTFRINCKR